MNGEFRKTKIMREIEPEWDKLMRFGQGLEYGRAEVIFKQGKPVIIQNAIKTIDLQKDDNFDDGMKVIPLV